MKGENKNYTTTGDPYAVYSNAPFLVESFKRSEVHIPVKVERNPHEQNYKS